MASNRFAARLQASFMSAAPLLLLVGLIVNLGAEEGGFFPEATAAAAVALAAALLLRTALAREPFAGFGRALASAAAPLGLFAIWTLTSALWSDSPGRALVEFNRVLLYLLVLLFFGSYARSLSRTRGLVRALALAATVLCAVAFLSRALPDVFEVPSGFAPSRLGFPLTYWNALGLLAAIGLVLCLSLTSDERGSSPVRVVAAAAIPVLGTTLLLTFSRGAIAVAVLAVAAYVVLAHTRGLITGLLAAAPFTVLAVVRAYEAELLATQNPTSPAAVVQGHELAGVVLLCAAGAAVIRGVLLIVDSQLRHIDVSRGERRGVLAAGAGILVLSALVVAVAADLPAQVDRQYREFARGGPTVSTGAATRDRLASASNSSRLEYWRVAREGFEEAGLAGQGAGTFETEWTQRRRDPNNAAVDAHSLYLETAAELGVVGLLLLLTALASILVGLAWSARGPYRAPWVALLCCVGAWMLRAAIDWDWEMPAVSVGVFAAGGIALASRQEDPRPGAPARGARVLVGVGVALVALVPAGTWIAQRSLDEARIAFDRGDCRQAIRSSREATNLLDVSPEPYELIGYCHARLGADHLAMRMMSNAVRRDPEHWRYWYGLAIVRGFAGLDPRAAADRAVRLNPGTERPRRLAQSVFRTTDPRQWERAARRAPVPPQRLTVPAAT